MNEKIIPITNEIRVRMKEKELVIFKNYLASTTRNSENEKFYDLAQYMVDVLPKDIERFKDLALFDKMIAEAGENAPAVIRIGQSETLNQFYETYSYTYKLKPNKPMIKELTQMYKELLEEEQNK